MNEEERKASIKKYQKQINSKILKSSKLPALLVILSFFCIYLAEVVFEIHSKWITIPFAILIYFFLLNLKAIHEDWDKIPEFEDDPVLDSKCDKVLTFISGYFIIIPFLIILLGQFWTSNFINQLWFWLVTIGFGILIAIISFKILLVNFPSLEIHSKQRLEELGRLFILLIMVAIIFLQGLFLIMAHTKKSSWIQFTHKRDSYEIFYKNSWVRIFPSRDEYQLIKDKDSIQVEIVPIVFGIVYFKKVETMN